MEIILQSFNESLKHLCRGVYRGVKTGMRRWLGEWGGGGGRRGIGGKGFGPFSLPKRILGCVDFQPFGFIFATKTKGWDSPRVQIISTLVVVK